ncbi:MAG: hydroxymethylbilane synthase [Deltaproteobacteria bacterium]|nr:hydroxymethylbilane synthase [Deltaproteobacteria bacterium]
MILRIGTRGSRLALAQSEWVRERVEERYPNIKIELVRIKTKGDKILDSPLSEIGGKGLFVKEIEDALSRKEVDVAVHSVKDVPTELPDGLKLAVFPKREDPHDAFISVDYETLKDLPEGSSVGTSSLRRSSQLLHMRPDLDMVSVRGNVDTRLRKLESGDFQAIILASAGLKRLGLSSRINQVIPYDELLPAIGQGALGLEIRKDDKVWEILHFMNHEPTEMAVRAERAFLMELEGGCQIPVAAYGRLSGDNLILKGMVAELDGSRIIKDEVRGQKDSPEDMGVSLARRLLVSGAAEILARIYERV